MRPRCGREVAEKLLRQRDCIRHVGKKITVCRSVPEDIRVWVKARKASRPAEDYHQASKVVLWGLTPKNSAKKGIHVHGGHHSCGQLRHLARDCSNNSGGSGKKVSPSTSRGWGKGGEEAE